MLESLKRKAKRMGLRICKQRGYDRYMIVDACTNCIVAGSTPIEYSYTLEDVDQFLNQ